MNIQARFTKIPVTVWLIGILIVAAVIRLVSLAHLPNGLYWDEMDIGYQAFSFLHTGKDYFGNGNLLHFHSLADYHEPLFVFAVALFVKVLGLTAIAVRLPSVVFGVAEVCAMYFLAKVFNFSKPWALIAALLLAVTPWHVQFSRIGFEAISMLLPCMLGVIFFYKGLTNPRWLSASAACFVLTMYCYGIAKLFVPLFVLAIVAIYWQELWQLPKKQLLLALVVGLILVLPLVGDSFLTNANMRFSQLAIYDNPTLSSQVDYERMLAAKAVAPDKAVGLSPSIADKLAINKPLLTFNAFTQNYLQTFSTEFLFRNGDTNLRHSPDPSGIGEFYEIAALGMLLGICFLVAHRSVLGKKAWVLATWIFLGPVPSALTVDGGNHAIRLLFLVIPLTLLCVFGIKQISLLNRRWLRYPFLVIFFAILSFETFFFLHYYFAEYRVESAIPFQYGFDQAARIAKQNESRYDKVIIDAGTDSDFMAYIFANKIDPHVVQAMSPFRYTDVIPNMESFKLDNVYILPPGHRKWANILTKDPVPGNNLYILADTVAVQSPVEIANAWQRVGKITNPDGTTAFDIYEQR